MSITVQRVETEGGSHIEPPLNPNETDLNKLLWHAAVLEADTGLRVTIQQDGKWFTLHDARSGIGGLSFREMWMYVNGMAHGAEAATR